MSIAFSTDWYWIQFVACRTLKNWVPISRPISGLSIIPIRNKRYTYVGPFTRLHHIDLSCLYVNLDLVDPKSNYPAPILVTSSA